MSGFDTRFIYCVHVAKANRALPVPNSIDFWATNHMMQHASIRSKNHSLRNSFKQCLRVVIKLCLRLERIQGSNLPHDAPFLSLLYPPSRVLNPPVVLHPYTPGKNAPRWNNSELHMMRSRNNWPGWISRYFVVRIQLSTKRQAEPAYSMYLLCGWFRVENTCLELVGCFSKFPTSRQTCHFVFFVSVARRHARTTAVAAGIALPCVSLHT